MAKRLLVQPDEVVTFKPSAARLNSNDLTLFCEWATERIESAAGRRLFLGLRTVDVLPTGSFLAALPDPPITSIIEVKVRGEGDALDLDGFKIEDARAGLVWFAAAWRADSLLGGPASEVDRNQAGAFPEPGAGATEPIFWRVRYESGAAISASYKILARELVSLKIDSINRQGVTAESQGGKLSRSFDFEKEEKRIRRDARRLAGRMLLR